MKMRDLGLFGLRVISGGLLAGHGAQKLFGSFDGPGLKGTAGWLDSLGMEPPKGWAAAAGLSEFGGGLLTTLGLFGPVGNIATIAAMSVAIVKAHLDQPIWASEGGAELPLTNIAIASALLLTGPGELSLDEALGIELPRPLIFATALAAAAGVVVAARMKPAPEAAQPPAEKTSQGDRDGAPRPSNGQRQPERAPELEIEFSRN